MKEWDDMILRASKRPNGRTFPFTLTRVVYSHAEKNEAFRGAVDRGVRRFLEGDWGSLCENSVKVNEGDIRSGQGRAMGIYPVPDMNEGDGDRLWIIADITGNELYAITALYPNEY